jgi:hypothetical protein
MAGCIVVLITTFVVLSGIIVSYASSKNNKTLAQIEFDVLMFQIETGIINVEALSDGEYMDIGHKIAGLITVIGKVKSPGEHYFRNYFRRAPETLSEMTAIIMNDENHIFAWQLSTAQNARFHMFGTGAEYNLKFVSADGHFEAVYNKDGVLLTEENDPLNMGTFNYANQLSEAEQELHYLLDVSPFFKWNNTAEAAQVMKENKIEPQDLDSNKDAMKRYKEYEYLLNRRKE